MIGETIKDFKIIARLGRGGMGEVFVAEQQIIKTKVAIKLLLADVSSDRRHVQRFFNEAIAVSKIKHAGIVKIFDVGFHEQGAAFLIMELLEGETLASRIKRAGRLAIGQVADLGRQIASVLEATHAAGITHRDLKPDNIFVVPDAELASGERVKILDFGIAKLGGSTGMTGTGSSMGTPAYMAPEQWADSTKADARADVYSVGCLVFEMCCGRTPFIAATIPEAYAKHLNETPPRLRTLVPDVPSGLDDVIARALAKQPSDRPAIKELGAVFAAIAAAQPRPLDATLDSIASAAVARVSGPVVAVTVPAEPTPRSPDTTLRGAASSASVPARPRRAKWVVAAGALAIVGGGAAVFAITRTSEDAPPIADKATPPPAVPPDAASSVAAAPGAIANTFVTIPLPPTPVRLGVEADVAGVRGFRPDRGIRSPSAPYALQEHEVTWSELEPWLAAQHTPIDYPPWAADPKTRGALPATGMTWTIAFAYCKSLGGSLPTDEQWEYAARGAERRPNSWGADRLDRARTHAFAGSNAVPTAVEIGDQDQTPPLPDGHRLYDLIGNVQEWTVGLWREDKAGADESWVESGPTSIRTIRGVPLAADPPASVPVEGAAYRDQFCATGPCVDKGRARRMYIGFRCAKAVR